MLALTYGRKGKRRRELCSVLTQADVSTSRNHDTAVAEQGDKDEKYKREWKPSLIVQALLRSQARYEAEGFGRGEARARAQIKLSPQVPELNTWGNPMPECRVRNKMRIWYKLQMAKLLPPLPERELQRLKDLADGSLREGLVPRRNKGTSVDDGLVVKTAGLNAELLVEGPPKSATFMHFMQDCDEGRPHILTPRFLRRMWQNVLEQVPAAALDEKDEKIKVTWPVQARGQPQVVRPSIDQAKMLFGE